MSVRPSSLVIALLAGALLVAAPCAEAQEDPRKAQAEAVFGEGVKLHDAGRDTEALEKYRRAYEIYPTTNILFAVARLEQLLGQSLEALRHYREALGSPLLHPKNQALGKGYVAELEKQLGRVDVNAPSGTTFTLDGRRFTLPLEGPLDVEPGSVVLEGTYGDAKYSGRTTVAAGGRVTLEMLPPSGDAGPATTAPSGPVDPPPATSKPSFWTGRRIAGAGVLVAGAGALIGGGLFLGASSDHDERAAALRADNPQGCAGAAGSSAICGRLSDEVDDAKRGQALGWVFLGGGAALVLGGAALFVWPSSSASPSSGNMGLRIRPRGAGLELQGSF